MSKIEVIKHCANADIGNVLADTRNRLRAKREETRRPGGISKSSSLDIALVIDDPDLQVWFHKGQGTRLVVSFSGVGKDDGPQKIEFPRIATDGGTQHALFVVDTGRTWLNAATLRERVVTVMEHYVDTLGIEDVITVGASMGGYAAALIAGYTKVDLALCLAPQSSVHPDVVGDDPRWPEMRARIPQHRVRSVADHIVPQTQYVVLFGDRQREAPQYKRFPKADNIDVQMLPDVGHGVGLALKYSGIMAPVIEALFARDMDTAQALLSKHMNAYARRSDQIDFTHAAQPLAVMDADLPQRRRA